MSQKIPFLFALTLVGSFAGLPHKKLDVPKSSAGAGRLPNGQVINFEEGPTVISILEDFRKTEEEQKKIEQDIKEMQNKFKRECPFSIESFNFEMHNYGVLLNLLMFKHNYKICLILDSLGHLFDLIQQKYPEENIISHLDNLDEEFKIINDKRKLFLDRFYTSIEEYELKSTNEYLDTNKELLIDIYKDIPSKIKLLSNTVLYITDFIQRKQQNVQNELNQIRKSLNEKIEEYNAVEAQIEEKKELAIKEWETKKEKGEFSESYIISNNIQVIEKYLVDNLLEKNAPIPLKIHSLKETLLALLPYILNRNDFLNIPQNLLQN